MSQFDYAIQDWQRIKGIKAS